MINELKIFSTVMAGTMAGAVVGAILFLGAKAIIHGTATTKYVCAEYKPTTGECTRLEVVKDHVRYTMKKVTP